MHLELQDARNLVVLAIRHLELWTLVTPGGGVGDPSPGGVSDP
jgi:hypothetical protein